ncbi:hypothetical protein AWL63_23445 (plasmid) [Sphingomonas panacis]|uniref:Uncharacterized protein n=1 Tax=Sphingomonas panacis TaxID=1560345 RepID=A0A1B3ZI80_9SPHN|nr:hypothetical protein [Sphingomonas panacis]AOH87131.1 hypothetical protein AWL63_23445 [Sphingomonas panacis]
MAYDESAEANCAKALAKFARDYGYDRFTWRGTLTSSDEPTERFSVEVRLSAGRTVSDDEDPAGALADRLVSYRSNSEFGPVHHIICDEAATLIWKLIAENGQPVSGNARQGDQIAREIESATELRTRAKAMLAAFGGDIPDWLRGEAGALDRAIAQAEER